MPNVRYSSGAIGTMRWPISLSFIQSRSSRTKAIVVATLLLPEPCLSSAYISSPGSLSGLARTTRLGSEPPSWRAALQHVLDLGGVLARVEERRGAGPVVGLVDVAVAHRQVEPVAELLEVVLRELLHLVGGVLALEGLDRPALDGVRQDHGRLAGVLGGGVERGVHLAVVVAAAGQLLDLLVAHVLDHLAQPRVGAEEVLADVGAVLDRVGLELAVRRGVHLVDQHAVDVAGEQLVPLAAPDHLDHVPAGAAEVRLELLDDLAVAAHRAVELLQVAVDHPGEVVELLAGGDADRAERLGLAHLAVAEERPDVLLRRCP